MWLEPIYFRENVCHWLRSRAGFYYSLLIDEFNYINRACSLKIKARRPRISVCELKWCFGNKRKYPKSFLSFLLYLHDFVDSFVRMLRYGVWTHHCSSLTVFLLIIAVRKACRSRFIALQIYFIRKRRQHGLMTLLWKLIKESIRRRTIQQPRRAVRVCIQDPKAGDLNHFLAYKWQKRCFIS